MIDWLKTMVRPPSYISWYFSPKGGCTEAIIKEIQNAKKSIYIFAYVFSSVPIAEALIANSKILKAVIIDLRGSKDNGSQLGLLLAASIAVRLDSQHNIMHSKIMIIDDSILITGSFNFTNNAELHNVENIVIIKNQPELIKAHKDNFDLHWGHSVSPETAKHLITDFGPIEF